MKAYRVRFDRLSNKRYHEGYLDVFAQNQKEAVATVKNRLYYDPSSNNNKFYPFHCKATRIDDNEMCRSVRWR